VGNRFPGICFRVFLDVVNHFT